MIQEVIALKKRFDIIALSCLLALCTGCVSTVPKAEDAEVPTEAATEPETEPVTEPQLTVPEKKLASMSLEEKVCQMFIVTPEQFSDDTLVTVYDDLIDEGIAGYPAGGVILFAQNLETQEQTKELLSALQEKSFDTCGIGMFTSIDEEGGSVARAAEKLGTTAFSPMSYYGAEGDTQQAYEIGHTLGTDLRSLGFNLDFAPVADVLISWDNELGDRIFSDDPQVVSEMVSNMVIGLQDSGVCATLKHFPGLGAASGNTHEDSAVYVSRTPEELRETEFVPFRGGIGAGASFVMVGHQIMECTGEDLPSDLSKTVITDWLRGEIGFDGIVITDSQQMNTIAYVYTPGEAAVTSIKAGADIILMPADYRAAVEDVIQAVKDGDISQERIDESVMRILEKKYELGLIDENSVKEAE